MSIAAALPPRTARGGRTIALHCSGGGAGEWRNLTEALGAPYEVLAPEHYGCASSGPWTGTHAFTLADEAARTLALIDDTEGKIHLVGHSYGGAVALYAALARPDRIASMALYEPSAFHLLRQMGEPGGEAYAGIAVLARGVGQAIDAGDHRGGIAAFVDYWNGDGAWTAMHPAAQDALVRWAPKVPLEFHAAIEHPTPASAYRALRFPVLILRGQHAPKPTRLVADGLADLLPDCRLTVVGGAGHMGPITHASEVSGVIVRHILGAEFDAWPRLTAVHPLKICSR